jgi:hypothetical protein
MEKLSHYLNTFKQHLPNLSLIESLFCFFVVINTLCILIERIYFSFVRAKNKMNNVVIDFSLSMSTLILVIISGIVTVTIVVLSL